MAGRSLGRSHVRSPKHVAVCLFAIAMVGALILYADVHSVRSRSGRKNNFDGKMRPDSDVSEDGSSSGYGPLIFGAGHGTTATHTFHAAICQLRLPSVHWDLNCNFAIKKRVPKKLPSGMVFHSRVIRAYKALMRCMSVGGNRSIGEEEDCPTINQTLHGMLHHIDNVIASKDVIAIHDAPYPNFGEYVISAAKRIRGSGPIVVLSERSPNEWAERRKEKHGIDLACKLGDGVSANLYRCLRVAVDMGWEDRNIRDIFHRISDVGPDAIATFANDFERYQDAMRTASTYHTNLFERNPRIITVQLAEEIEDAIGTGSNADFPRVEASSRSSFRGTSASPRRGLFNPQGRLGTFVSGRISPKLVLFVNFRGAGGDSLLRILDSFGVMFNLCININPGQFDDSKIHAYDGFTISSNCSSLKIRSSKSMRAHPPLSFWNTLYDRGVDLVNLDYNYLNLPTKAQLSPLVYQFTVLCHPWDRYRAMNPSEEESVLGDPNFYVRMLNGMMDRRNNTLTQEHLKHAQAVLGDFASVIIMEDGDRINHRKLRRLFGFTLDSIKKKGRTTQTYLEIAKPKGSYNETQKGIFEVANKLDMELFEYARKKFSGAF